MAVKTHNIVRASALRRFVVAGAGQDAASAPLPSALGRAAFGWETCAGRLSELSGVGAVARLTLAFSLVRDAQRRGEPVAWITDRQSTFFPPDAAAGRVDLAQLPVIFVADAAAAARAAVQLARSGSFGALVMDLAAAPSNAPAWLRIPPPLMSQLVGLAQQHDIALVFITDTPTDVPSLGSLISLRCETRRQDAGHDLFLCVARALKDKRRGPGWSYTQVHRGPVGLR